MEKSERRESKFKRYLEILTNLAIVSMVIAYAIVFARNYLSKPKQVNPVGSEFVKGSRIADIPGVDFSTHSNTVLLALNTGCRYCTESIGFYKQLAEYVSKNNKACQLVAVFPNEADTVSKYVEEHHLSIKHVGKVNYDTLNVKATPSLLLIDNEGKIKNYWTGKLSEDREKEVFDSVLKVAARGSAPDRTSDTAKTINIFDESKPLVSVEVTSGQINEGLDAFGVDGNNNLYVGGNNYAAKYDASGRLLKKMDVSNIANRGVACVDKQGNIYIVTNRSQVSVYSSDLESKIREITIPRGPAAIHEVLEISACDSNRKLYIQTLTKQPWSQSLYSIDIDGSNAKLIHKVDSPAMFYPFHGPGAFSFAVGDKYLYISDVSGYKINMYSIIDDSLVNTVVRPFTQKALYKEDGRMKNRGLVIEDVTVTGAWRYYPPIASIDFAPSGKVLAWTYDRDRHFRQVVHVFDSELNYVGSDLKFNDPVHSRYFFTKDMVIASDFGFGKEYHFNQLSPIDTVTRPRGVKMFRLSFSPLTALATAD